MKKVALPIRNNQISPDFEGCSEFLIFTVENEKSIKKHLVFTHLQPGLFPYWLAKKGVTDLIAKGIDIHAVNKFNQFKINVFVGVKSINPKVLLEEYLSGDLDTNGSFVDD
jgi:predicted Fe-Mo cluster-binding NifX family protein